MSMVTHNRFIYKFMMKNIAQVICLSQAMADDLIYNYGLSKQKAYVIPPFINSDLTIIGDGEERENLEKLAGENVTFKGRQYNVHEYHAAASCQVLTSHNEGFPLALVEACANGVPMVSFDGPSGPRDAIIDGENGFVVPQYDVQALADAILKTLEKNWDRQKIRDSASQFNATLSKSPFATLAI